MEKFKLPSAESPVILTLDDYNKVAKFNKGDFDEAWRREATIYREIIWALANQFSDGQCEITHSEFVRDKVTGEVKTISLCLSFFEDSGYNFLGFTEYIKKHINLVPDKLRKSLTVYASFNYGNDGGVKITDQEVEYLNQATVDLEAAESDGSIGIGAGIKTINKAQKVYLKVVVEIKKIKGK